MAAAGPGATPAGDETAWMPAISELVLDPGLRSLTFHFIVPRGLPIFRGHFPGLPIVPGALQVGWAAELARTHGLETGRCTGIVTAKFRRLMLPGMRMAARLEPGPQAGQVRFEYASDGAVVSTGRLQFRSA
jgi:3-hydroxyacyl-[acyl-carrier-protein] dehydratase